MTQEKQIDFPPLPTASDCMYHDPSEPAYTAQQMRAIIAAYRAQRQAEPNAAHASMQADYLLAARVAEGYLPDACPSMSMPLAGLLYAKAQRQVDRACESKPPKYGTQAGLSIADGTQAGQAPSMTVAFDEGAKEPRIVSWNKHPAGTYWLYSAPQPAQVPEWGEPRIHKLAADMATKVAKNASTAPQLCFPYIYLGLKEALLDVTLTDEGKTPAQVPEGVTVRFDDGFLVEWSGTIEDGTYALQAVPRG